MLRARPGDPCGRVSSMFEDLSDSISSTINDTLGPEVCERPGLFRHPTECGKFYECYWDKWVEKYTLHVFPCPVVLGYDTCITACNWPFDGPQCQS